VRRERKKRLAKRLAVEDLEEAGDISRKLLLRRVGAPSKPPSCVRRIENPRLCNEV
jgi:hypothetical protein